MPLTRTLTAGRFDLVVVGGGIHGLFAAYDAALRGLAVALVERGDFGGELSFNHQRTIHGGLRALEQFALGKVQQQLRERATWARIAPHYVRPLPFVTGTYRFSKRSRAILGAAFVLYNNLSRGSERTALHALPNASLVGPAEARRLFPGIHEDGLTGAARWYDLQLTHADRLNWLVARAAMDAGAVLENYVEACSFAKKDGRIVGVDVRDVETGAEARIETRATLLAAGKGLGPMFERAGVGDAPPLVAASNVLFTTRPGDVAWAARGQSGRMLTAVPWRGSALVGTFQSDTFVAADAHPPTSGEVRTMVDDARSAFPELGVSMSDVALVHHGLTPGVMRGGRAALLPESIVTDHQRDGVGGLYSIVGVKFTTARATAEQAIDTIASQLGSSRRSETADRRLPFSSAKPVEVRSTKSEVRSTEGESHLEDWYGSEHEAVRHYCAARGLSDRLSPDSPVLSGEIAYAVEHAKARRLADAVLRRSALGSTGHPGRAALERAAAIMGEQRGWSHADIHEEIAHVETRYPPRT